MPLPQNIFDEHIWDFYTGRGISEAGLCVTMSNVILTYLVGHFLLNKVTCPDTAHLGGIDDMALQLAKRFNVKSKLINHGFISHDNICIPFKTLNN